MQFFQRSIAVSILCVCCVSASPPVKFPEPPAPPALPQKVEVPVLATLGPVVLNEDELYVVEQTDDKKPALLVAAPDGIVKVTAEVRGQSGPLRVRGKFVGGNGKVQTKTFKAAKVCGGR